MFLALDTATDVPSLALGAPDAPGTDIRLADRRALSRDIERLVAELCRERGVPVGAIAGVVLADGPGSFTGLRIGAAFAKGLCRALGVPLHTVPSLVGAAVRAADRAGCARPLEVVARYDALRGQCFRAVVRVAAEGADILVPAGLAPAGEELARGQVAATETDASASALLGLLGRRGGPVRVDDVAAWQPDYGRPAEAEARRAAGGDAT
jgi:tRNA threonylcarbamoyladenosine biosynthesis protein TsaB